MKIDSAADRLGADMARSGIARREKTRWHAKHDHRVRPKLSEDQDRLKAMSPAMAEQARKDANKARYMAQWERDCAAEVAARRRARGEE